MISATVGEIRMLAFAGVPAGWLPCQGQWLRVHEYPRLFSVIGNVYGGDGVSFAVPDLRGRVAVGVGALDGGASHYGLGETGGQAEVVLQPEHLPRHRHSLNALDSANRLSESGQTGFFGKAQVNGQSRSVYAPPTDPLVTLHPDTIDTVGGGRQHENVMPFVAMSFVICGESGHFPVPAGLSESEGVR